MREFSFFLLPGSSTNLPKRTVENAPLLYDAGNTNLKIFDATSESSSPFREIILIKPPQILDRQPFALLLHSTRR